MNNYMLYGAVYFVLVFAFTFFYTAVTFDPEAIAKNLQRNGSFIPGIRPGDHTAEYLGNLITRLTLVGALFLAVVAVLPIGLQMATGIAALAIGGTAILIVVQVVLDLIRRLDAQVSMREY
jgi:preprotein translocase subunit SecY